MNKLIFNLIGIYLCVGLFLLLVSKEQNIKIDAWYFFFIMIFWPIAVVYAFYKSYKKIRAQRVLKGKFKKR